MKKIGIICREKIVDQLKSEWAEFSGCIFIGLDKVSAFSFNRLRNGLRKEKSSVLVSKISLMKRALENLGVSSFEEFLDGPTGLVFVGTDGVVNVCKILFEFSKENEAFSLRGGFLNDKKINAKELEAISKLPSREFLMAQAVMTIASPLTGFLAAANNIILKFVWVVNEIKKKKEV